MSELEFKFSGHPMPISDETLAVIFIDRIQRWPELIPLSQQTQLLRTCDRKEDRNG